LLVVLNVFASSSHSIAAAGCAISRAIRPRRIIASTYLLG
jgi:hypothetical protein